VGRSAARSQVSTSERCCCLFASHRQAFTDARCWARGGVVAFGAAETAHRVGDKRMDRLAGEVVAFGESRHDHRGPDVPDRAAQQHGVVLCDRGQRVLDRRSRVGVLFTDVALDGRVVAARVRLHGVDAVHVAVDQLADHAGEHLGIADLQIPPAAVVVVLPRP
jgi:hypothetical protein